VKTLFKAISIGATALSLIAVSASTVLAGGHGPSWNLSNTDSKVAFGSGNMNDNGVATIEIDLASVNTNIDIRNERMQEHVFADKGSVSTLSATIDPKAVNDLAPGATAVIDVAGKLALGDVSLDINTTMFVAKLTDDKMMVTTDKMVMVSTEALGINAGVDKLMELAGLPSIDQ